MGKIGGPGRVLSGARPEPSLGDRRVEPRLYGFKPSHFSDWAKRDAATLEAELEKSGTSIILT